MTPEEEYRLLFQTEKYDWSECEKVADGHVTVYCQEHEQAYLKEAAERGRRKAKNPND